jgi:hypothetical protein
MGWEVAGCGKEGSRIWEREVAVYGMHQMTVAVYGREYSSDPRRATMQSGRRKPFAGSRRGRVAVYGMPSDRKWPYCPQGKGGRIWDANRGKGGRLWEGILV